MADDILANATRHSSWLRHTLTSALTRDLSLALADAERLVVALRAQKAAHDAKLAKRIEPVRP